MIRGRESLSPAFPGPAGQGVLHPTSRVLHLIIWVVHPRSGCAWGPASISLDPALCEQFGIGDQDYSPGPAPRGLAEDGGEARIL